MPPLFGFLFSDARSSARTSILPLDSSFLKASSKRAAIKRGSSLRFDKNREKPLWADAFA